MSTSENRVTMRELFFRFVVTCLLTLFYNIYYGLLVILFKIFPFRDGWPQILRLEPPPILSDPKFGIHQYVKVNNANLHYVESGDQSKPLMIFVHGFPEFWYSWRHQILEFKKDYWCVAVDLRGYGESEKFEEQSAYKIEEVTEDLRCLLRHLGRDKCIFVAHDWGSLIAFNFRDLYPDAVNALVVIGGSSREAWNRAVWNDSEQFWMSWYVFFFLGWWVPEQILTYSNMETTYDKTFGKHISDTLTQKDIECYKYVFGRRIAMRFTPPLSYYRENYSLTAPLKKKDDRQIPCIAMLGDKDAYLSQANNKYLKEIYPNIECVMLEGASHFVMQQEPTRVNDVIKEFILKNNVL